MPLTVQKLNSERASFDWPYADDVVHVTYNPQAFTPEVERRLTDEMKGEYKAETLAFMLSLMLVDWDLIENVPKLDGEGNPLLNEDGTPVWETIPGEAEGTYEYVTRPFGVELEKLYTLPITFIGDAISAITEDIKAARELGKTSGGGSPQTA